MRLPGSTIHRFSLAEPDQDQAVGDSVLVDRDAWCSTRTGFACSIRYVGHGEQHGLLALASVLTVEQPVLAVPPVLWLHRALVGRFHILEPFLFITGNGSIILHNDRHKCR